MATTRKKTTLYFDPELLRAVRDEAARSGRQDYEVLEDAVRRYLAPTTLEDSRRKLHTFLDRRGEQATLEEQEALDLAYDELHAARRARRALKLLHAVMDTGVLVAAALTPRGVCGRVVRAATDDRCKILLCPMLLAELEDVLLHPKFRRSLSEEDARRYGQLIAAVGELHPNPTIQRGLTPDPDDDYLVALAEAIGADCIVSGDPHLRKLAVWDAPVLTPREFLERLASDESTG